MNGLVERLIRRDTGEAEFFGEAMKRASYTERR